MVQPETTQKQCKHEKMFSVIISKDLLDKVKETAFKRRTTIKNLTEIAFNKLLNEYAK